MRETAVDDGVENERANPKDNIVIRNTVNHRTDILLYGRTVLYMSFSKLENHHRRSYCNDKKTTKRILLVVRKRTLVYSTTVITVQYSTVLFKTGTVDPYNSLLGVYTEDM